MNDKEGLGHLEDEKEHEQQQGDNQHDLGELDQQQTTPERQQQQQQERAQESGVIIVLPQGTQVFHCSIAQYHTQDKDTKHDPHATRYSIRYDEELACAVDLKKANIAASSVNTSQPSISSSSRRQRRRGRFFQHAQQHQRNHRPQQQHHPRRVTIPGAYAIEPNGARNEDQERRAQSWSHLIRVADDQETVCTSSSMAGSSSVIVIPHATIVYDQAEVTFPLLDTVRASPILDSSILIFHPNLDDNDDDDWASVLEESITTAASSADKQDDVMILNRRNVAWFAVFIAFVVAALVTSLMITLEHSFNAPSSSPRGDGHRGNDDHGPDGGGNRGERPPPSSAQLVYNQPTMSPTTSLSAPKVYNQPTMSPTSSISSHHPTMSPSKNDILRQMSNIPTIGVSFSNNPTLYPSSGGQKQPTQTQQQQNNSNVWNDDDNGGNNHGGGGGGGGGKHGSGGGGGDGGGGRV